MTWPGAIARRQSVVHRSRTRPGVRSQRASDSLFQMNILVWATTFGADLWSMTRFLSRQPGITVKVVMGAPSAFLAQPVARLFPLDVELVSRRFYHAYTGIPFFRPDVTLLDNWLPRRALSPKGLMLWHGFGWGAGTDARGFANLFENLRNTWGDIQRPNPRFRWQCFGPTDFGYRTTHSGIAADNCLVLGAASHDDLRRPVARSALASAYPFDIGNRKTVLIAPTWAYGEMFSHWGDHLDLLATLVQRIAGLGANTILRLHDRFRFDAAHQAAIAHVARAHPALVVKYKDEAPDNLLDMQVADVLITNFSSIANLFYATRRPTIHVYPAVSADSAITWRTLGVGARLDKHVGTIRSAWKMPPEDNGGLLARSFAELLLQLEQALSEPDCCAEAADQFLNTHMLPPDGRACERTHRALQALVADR